MKAKCLVYESHHEVWCVKVKGEGEKKRCGVCFKAKIEDPGQLVFSSPALGFRVPGCH